MPTKFQIKRTSVTGRTPNTTNVSNTSYIAAGELALNLTDKKLFSSDGTNYFEAGSNLSSLVVATSIDVGANLDINTSTIFIGNSTVNTTVNSSAISVSKLFANGTTGTAGQVLTSNSIGGIYWSTSSGSGGGDLTLTSDTFNGNGSNTVFTLSTTSSTDKAFVYLNGVQQAPTVDYTVSGTTLTFVTAPPSDNVIEVRTVEIPSVSDLTVTSDVFTGNGSNTQFTLSVTDSSTSKSLVFLNGVAQRPTTDYSISSSTITFTTAPANLQQIQVISFTADDIKSSVFTGNGTNTQFTLPIVSSTSKTIVSLNGVTQVPVTDYSVSGTTLVFTVAPVNGEQIIAKSIQSKIDSAGANTQIQYNKSGSLGGSAGFTFNETTNNVTIANTLTVPNFILNASNPPASPTAAGTTGTFAWDSNYFYIATGTNTWRKVNISANGVGGSNTNILYNDSNTFAGSAGFTFNNTTNNVTIANTLLIGANVTANTSTIFVGNSTVNTVITAGNIALNGSQLTIGNTTVNTTFTGDTFTLGNTFANTTAIRVGNSTVNTVINSTSITTSGVSTLSLGNTSITGDLVVSGNVFFNGTTTNVNSTNLVVEDKNIILGDVGTPTDVTADGGGITLKGATDKTLNWVDATDAWTSSEDFNLLTGKQYEINGTQVINSTSLGTGVTGSSLTSVGTLTTLAAGNTTINGTLTVNNPASPTAGFTVSNNAVSVYILANAGAGAYNGLVSAGDNLIYFSNNTQNNGNLVIGSWTTFTGGYGIKLTGNTYDVLLRGNTVQFSNSSATTLFAASNGNVGIGNTTPGARLRVEANTSINGTVFATTFDVGSNMFLGTSGGNLLLNFDSNDYLSYDKTNNQLNLFIGGVAQLTQNTTTTSIRGNQLIFANTDTSTTVSIRNEGNNTTARYPQLAIVHYGANTTGGDTGGFPVVELFRLRGNTSVAAAVASGDILGGFNTWGSNTTGSNLSATRVEGIAEANFTSTATAGIRLITTNAGTQSEKVRIAANGNVGIGNTAPTVALQVITSATAGAGAAIANFGTSAAVSRIRIVDENSTGSIPPTLSAPGTSWGIGIAADFATTAPIIFYTGTIGTANERMRINNTGTGVGTATPADIFHVRKDSTGNIGAIIQNRSATGTPESGVKFITGAFDLADSRYSEIASAGGSSSDLSLRTSNGGAPTTKVYIAANGNVGIGNTAPTAPLSLNGNAIFGNTTTTGTLVVYNTNADANVAGGVTVDVNGPVLRVGDRNIARTFANGVGIKIHDSGAVHYSVGQIGNAFVIADTSSDADSLYPASRTNIFTANNTLATVGVPFNVSSTYTTFGSTGQTTLSLTTSATTANQVVATAVVLGAAVWRSVKYRVQVTSGTAYQFTEISIVHDGTTVYKSEYGTVLSGALLATFDADISGGNIRLLTTPVNAVTVYKGLATMVAV